MAKISRRNFLKNVIRTTSGVVVLGSNAPLLSSCINNDKTSESRKIFIPLPIQVVIDDVGWWSGEDGSKRQEPYRTGINRNHVPSDYQAIADLGRALGIRPQAAFILCEWDKELLHVQNGPILTGRCVPGTRLNCILTTLKSF